MFTRRLASLITSGEKKGEKAQVKITNETLGFPKENPLLIDQDSFEYPQFGPKPEEIKNEKGEITGEKDLTEEQAQVGLDEFVVNAGSKVRALEIINDATRDAALYEGKSHIRLYDQKTEDVQSVVNVGLKKSREFTWKATERVTVKEFKNALDEMRGSLDSLTPEQIAERVKKLLGAA